MYPAYTIEPGSWVGLAYRLSVQDRTLDPGALSRYGPERQARMTPPRALM